MKSINQQLKYTLLHLLFNKKPIIQGPEKSTAKDKKKETSLVP